MFEDAAILGDYQDMWVEVLQARRDGEDCRPLQKFCALGIEFSLEASMQVCGNTPGCDVKVQNKNSKSDR